MLQKVRFIFMIASILFLRCQSAPAKTEAGDSNMTEAIGVAPIINHLVGQAKDEALKDAKRVAVQQVLGSLIAARSDVHNFALVSQKVSMKTEGMIEKYEILSASAVSEQEYQVKIRAKVNAALISQTIEETIAGQGKPRMMVLVDESFQDKKDLNKIAQTELELQFIAQGFPFVDKATVQKILQKNKKKISDALGGNEKAARELGVDAGAEIILVGSSRVKTAGAIAGTNLISVQSDINVRVIDINSGKILTAGQEHGAYPHINPESGAVFAVRKAVTPLREKLVADIVKLWDPNRAQTISLLVTGLTYEQLLIFRSEMLSRVRGVKTINPKGSTGKAAQLEVEFEGTSFDLADRLLQAGLSFQLKMGEVKPSVVSVGASK